jgi:hypothetical protein
MKRRAFLRTLGGAAAATGVPANSLLGSHADLLPYAPSPSESEYAPTNGAASFQKWCWVHGGAERSEAEWDRAFGKLAQADFTGVLVGGGDTEILGQAAHRNGLEFHRWIWTLNRNGDAWVRENHPEWFTVSRDGNSSLTTPPYVDYYRWLCPTKEGVRAYLGDSISDIARDPVVDGIHLDYIRHSDVILPRGLWSKYDLIQDREYPEFDFCYCETCREAYSSQTGKDPLDLPDPTQDPEWRRFRWDSVTGLVKVLAEAVHGVPVQGPGLASTDLGTGGAVSVLRPNSPGKPISAAVFPTPTIARALVRQAWEEWPLDAFFPMLYHEFYEEGLDWIGTGIREGLDALGTGPEETPPGASARKLLAGLYLPTLNRDQTKEEAVGVVRRAGADGVSFFEMNGLGI